MNRPINESRKVMRRRLIGRLRSSRSEIFKRICDRPNVIGSMIGVKYRGGVRTNRLGLTVFVSEKIPKNDLDARARIPKTIQVAGNRIYTDVVTWRSMGEQALDRASILYDGYQQGTLTGFGRRGERTYGLSCAHCLAGQDRNPASPTAISMYSLDQGKYLDVGQSLFSVYSAGPGNAGDFGYIDCGLFSLTEDSMIERARRASPLESVRDLRDLIGQPLSATSSLHSPGYDQVRHAQVIGIEFEAFHERCDVVLEVQSPGTFRGDSGMLWITPAGKAAAMHARGELMPPGKGSRLTTAMSVARAEQFLQIQLAADR